MSDDNVIALNLARHTPDASLDLVRGVLEDSLAVIRDLLASDNQPTYVMTSQKLEECRLAWSKGARAADVVGMTSSCLKAARGLVVEKQTHNTLRVSEMATLVSAVREVVATVGSEMTNMQSSLQQSTNRFDIIGQLTDPQQLRTRLMAEVTNLKDLAVSRRRAWEESAANLTQRVNLLEQQLAATQNEAETDPLTNISNRRVWERTCAAWLRGPRMAFTLAILDVDNFKDVNDAHGHDAGDDVLRFIGRSLSGALREGDVVARIGGDEFGVLMRNIALGMAERRLRDILGRMSKAAATGPEALPVPPSVSCGIAEFSAGDSFASLSKRADEALYSAKRQGKNRVVSVTRPFIRDLMRR